MPEDRFEELKRLFAELEAKIEEERRKQKSNRTGVNDE